METPKVEPLRPQEIVLGSQPQGRLPIAGLGLLLILALPKTLCADLRR